MKRVFLLSAFGLLFLFCSKADRPHSIFPKPAGSVNDFADIIDADSENQIASLITGIKSRGLAEIAVCTIDSIPLAKAEYRDPMFYAADLFNAWGIGDKEKKDGLLIFVSVKDRKTAINTGYFTELVLNDSTCGRILDKTVLPNFRNGDYGKGIIEGIKVIEDELDKNIRTMYPERYKHSK